MRHPVLRTIEAELRRQGSEEMIRELAQLVGRHDLAPTGLDELVEYLTESHGQPEETSAEGGVRKLDFRTADGRLRLFVHPETSDLVGFSFPFPAQMTGRLNCAYYSTTWANTPGSVWAPPNLAVAHPLIKAIAVAALGVLARLDALRRQPQVERAAGMQLCRPCVAPCSCSWWRGGTRVSKPALIPAITINLPFGVTFTIPANVLVIINTKIRAVCS